MNRVSSLFAVFISFVFLFTFSACEDDNGIVEQYPIALNATHSIPTHNFSGTGVGDLIVKDDNTLEFTLEIRGVATTDELTVAHLHSGAPNETGDVLLTLVDGTSITFDSDNKVTATVDITADLIAALETDAIYLNVHSTEAPNGLMRGQINESIVWSANVVLSPANEVPPVTSRNETGICALRQNDAGKLYYWINVGDLNSDDQLTAAHIHMGAADTNGDVVHVLADEASDFVGGFDVLGTLDLSAAQITALQTGNHYVNVHSAQVPNGLLRGQVE